MKVLFFAVLMILSGHAVSAEYKDLAVAKLRFKGHYSDPGCHTIDGCKGYFYEIVAVKNLCGTDFQVGSIFSTIFGLGEWYQPNPCHGPLPSAACSNEFVFIHDEYAVLVSGDGVVYPTNLSALIDYTCE